MVGVIMRSYLSEKFNTQYSAEQSRLLTENEGQENGSQSATFAERVNAVGQEPLTPLIKILLILILVLLLSTSVGFT